VRLLDGSAEHSQSGSVNVQDHFGLIDFDERSDDSADGPNRLTDLQGIEHSLPGTLSSSLAQHDEQKHGGDQQQRQERTCRLGGTGGISQDGYHGAKA
jgi:hypothetical protein